MTAPSRASLPYPTTPLKYATLGELLDRLGVPPSRVRLTPPPGRATEQDWLEQHTTEDRLCELVEGTLVEKPMGWRAGWLATQLVLLLGPFVRDRNLGVVVADGSPYRLKLGLIRLPDVAFVSWDRIPDPAVFTAPDRPVLDAVPDLAVEVVSESNTAKEMAEKLEEYFRAGVRLVWYVDPNGRSVDVYTSVKKRTTVGPGGAPRAVDPGGRDLRRPHPAEAGAAKRPEVSRFSTCG